MTEPKNEMPDVVRVWKNGRLYCRDYNDMKEPIHAHNSSIEEYYRAEPVEALLRQARDALVKYEGDLNGHINRQAHVTIIAIDTFLEGKE